jgi:hypothetical protein
MASERPEPRFIVPSVAAAAGEGAASRDPGMDELLNENKRLREVVIYLSGIIIRNVLGRR